MTTTLRDSRPLVPASQITALRRELSSVAHGRAFVLQGGDCAETFADPAPGLVARQADLFTIAARMLADSLGAPVLPVARIAGQFAKPRSSMTETIGTQTITSFLGHLVNDPDATVAARTPDPDRLVQGYRHAGRTLALLDEHRNAGGPMHRRWGNQVLWTSHEALVLDYEEPLARFDVDQDEWFLTSTHLPWIGERTRRHDGAHVEFLSGVANPVGCKIGPTAEADDVVRLCERLDPDRQPGRLLLIARMGAGMVARRLPALVRAVARAGHPVIWMCDPMHGNTVRAGVYKTRSVDEICSEIEGFVASVRAAGGWPGGLHLECTPDAVTECIGGTAQVGVSDLPVNYATACDPRLNRSQTLDVVRFTADVLR